VPVTVMIVDDHPLVLSGFRFIAEARSEIELVGEAGTVEDAIAMARSVRPDVIVMDIGLGSRSGIDAARTIRAARPETRVLFVTMHDDETTVLQALQSGGSGYVLKGADDDELIRAIQAVHAGEVILGRNVGEIVLQGVSRIEPARERFPYLTERENEVLELLATGEPNGTIATRLGVSRKTIANHIANILTKIHAVDRSQAILLARDAGYGT
jgi:DNA-binding NarL/FixJ family response regulator